jgi:hypothetical protein
MVYSVWFCARSLDSRLDSIGGPDWGANGETALQDCDRARTLILRCQQACYSRHANNPDDQR